MSTYRIVRKDRHGILYHAVEHKVITHSIGNEDSVRWNELPIGYFEDLEDAKRALSGHKMVLEYKPVPEVVVYEE